MKEKYCKYRLPCLWCDKYDRRCEHIEFLIAKENYDNMIKEHEEKFGCVHEWCEYIIDFDEKRKFIAKICSKCSKATIEQLT